MPIIPEDSDTVAASVYQLRDLNSPCVSGTLLRILSTLLNQRYLGYPFRLSIFHASGFSSFRVRHTPPPPQNHPTLTPLPFHYPLPSQHPTPTHPDLDTLFHILNPPTPSDPFSTPRPTIVHFYHAYRHDMLTPLQVARAILDLIPRSNSGISSGSDTYGLNAIQLVNRSDLLSQAEASTRRWERGTPLCVLDGVPFTVKVNLDANGYSTHCGSYFDEFPDGHVPDGDAVAALKKAGMILVGKTGMDEVGVGVRGFSMNRGQVRNPHGRRFVPGGSSGGCAASVACGLCPVSIGADAGGSIRIPSACCGVYGIKATFGRLSTRGRALAERGEWDIGEISVGPIAGCSRDLALMYRLMAGWALQESVNGEGDFEGRVDVCTGLGKAGGVDGLKVGVCKPWVESCEGDGLKYMREVVGRIVQQGGEVVPVVIPDLEDARVSLQILLMRRTLRMLRKKGIWGGSDWGWNLGYDPRAKFKMSEMFTEDDERRAEAVRGRVMEYCVKELFDGFEIDVLVTPALGLDTPAVAENVVTGLVDSNTDSRMMKYMLYANLTGIPGCIVPVGRDGNGMPVAVQFMSRPWEEKKLLDICLWAETEFDTEAHMIPKEVYNPLEEARKVKVGTS
eukprot:GFKZ01014596.1.p1 GENE.GFKZ01014596.1~~GFKZ01014596.1.p1  ORF type:complete len:663 (-),score=68.14 GFKZ01014596.1:977-2839(-)